MYNMDLENGGRGDGAANNQQEQVQVQVQVGVATPDPAGDYLRSGEVAALCLVAVVLSSLGALLVGLAFTTIPLTMKAGSIVVFQSYSDERAFMAEFTCGVMALALGCASAAILALRCCRGSHSFQFG